jgi:hypothetical protein
MRPLFQKADELTGIHLQTAQIALLDEPGEDFCHSPPSQDRLFSGLTLGGFRI